MRRQLKEETKKGQLKVDWEVRGLKEKGHEGVLLTVEGGDHEETAEGGGHAEPPLQQHHHPAGDDSRRGESCNISRHKRMPRSKSWASQGGIAPNEGNNMQKVTLINLIDERDRGEDVREAKRKDKRLGEEKTEDAGKMPGAEEGQPPKGRHHHHHHHQDG